MKIDEPPENAQSEQAITVVPGASVRPRQHAWSVLRHRNYALLF